jgi:hypothetical protein
MPHTRDALPDKAKLKDELVRLLAAELETRERAHRSTMEGATHEEAKPENDKDTRALEQSYLARGEAQRVEEAREGVLAVRTMPLRDVGPDDPVALGTLVVGEEDGTTVLLLVAPAGGGSRLAEGRVDDECEIEVAGRIRAIRVAAVK